MFYFVVIHRCSTLSRLELFLHQRSTVLLRTLPEVILYFFRLPDSEGRLCISLGEWVVLEHVAVNVTQVIINTTSVLPEGDSLGGT